MATTYVGGDESSGNPRLLYEQRAYFRHGAKETNEPIGCIGLVPVGAEHYKPLVNEREVGYWIGYPYWGKGLTSEALKSLIEFCCNNLRLDSLMVTTDATNKASQRVAEKCGFVNFTDYDYNGTPSKAFRLSLSSLIIRKVDDDKREFMDFNKNDAEEHS